MNITSMILNLKENTIFFQLNFQKFTFLSINLSIILKQRHNTDPIYTTINCNVCSLLERYEMTFQFWFNINNGLVTSNCDYVS